MNACAFNQFHNAGNEYGLAVTDGIHLHFLAADIFIYKNRLVFVDLHRSFEVFPQSRFLGNNLHGAATQHKTGAHQNGIADFFGSPHTIFDIGHSLPFGLRNAQFQKQFFKGVTVFCLFNSGTVRANDLHATLHQRLGQIDGRLTAQCGNHTLRLLHLDDVHHILHRKRFKVELIGAGVVSRDCLRVVVDDDGLVACGLDGLHCMDGGIVKLHALPNPDGTAAKNNDLFLFRDRRLVFHLIGGIEVRDIALKLRGAGVDHLVDRLNSGALTHFIYLKLRPSPLAGDLLVGKAHAFGKVQFLHAAGVFL